MNTPIIKIALLDMYDGVKNQGFKNITDILDMQILPFDWQRFDVRGKNEIPSLDYDIYISTGGPGNPLDGDGVWDKNFFELIDSIVEWNKNEARKKYVFLICHSFQMICHHLNLGTLTKRISTSFGILPMHKTEDGIKDPILCKLPDPFFAADHRDYQIIQPNLEVFEKFGAKILCLEKIRDHVDYERAIMAVRLSNEIFATQFHPEADAVGMTDFYKDKVIYQKSVEAHGEAKVKETINNLNDPFKVSLTNRTVIPTFLKLSIAQLLKQGYPEGSIQQQIANSRKPTAVN